MNVTSKLYDFQIKTKDWMKEQETKYDGGMLLNEAGLGKSISLLSVITESQVEKTLIICPAGIIDNWVNEIYTHTNISKSSVLKYYGPNRKKESFDEKRIYITGYSTVSSEFRKSNVLNGEFENDSLMNLNFDRIILDEGHYIRNRNTTCHKSIILLGEKNLLAKKWIVTATPIFNTQKDSYSYFKFLQLEVIDSLKDWNAIIKKTKYGIQKHNNLYDKYSICLKKKDVLKELPIKNELKINLKFNQLENDFYSALKEYSIDRIKLILRNIKMHKNNTELQKILKNNIMVYILRLKQACNNPLLVLKSMKRLDSGNILGSIERL